MRVLITTDTVGGVWTFTSELTQQLLQAGHSVHLVSFGRKPSAEQQAWTESQAQFRDSAGSASQPSSSSPTFTYTASEIPLEWMQDNEAAFEAGQTLLLNLLQNQPPDLILSNQFCFGSLKTSIPRVVVAHSDVLSWAQACRPTALDPTPWLVRYIAMVQAGLLEASAVIAPTAWMGRQLAGNFHLPRHLFVIPNGVTVEPAQGLLTERKIQAITAGRLWDEAKGLDTLRTLNSPMPLLVAGDNTFEATYQNNTWPEHLQNLGPLGRRDLHQQFRESAVYLCTSRYEPFGLAPLEAALCGCAVVARDLPSLREVWEEGAMYFSDNASLQNALTTLAHDTEQLAAAQVRSHARALRFTAERMADSYLHLFHSVVSQQALPHVA